MPAQRPNLCASSVGEHLPAWARLRRVWVNSGQRRRGSGSAASLEPGEKISGRVRLAPSVPLLYDLDVLFAFEVDSSADTVQDLYAAVRMLTFLTDPTDTDGDGRTDAFEDFYNLNKDNPVDAAQDPDRDGLTNAEEYTQRTDPRKRDADGDGFDDRQDFCPLDPKGNEATNLGDACEEYVPGRAVEAAACSAGAALAGVKDSRHPLKLQRAGMS